MNGARDDAVREATRIQRAAAAPDRSYVLRASAGAGKTKVLVDRLLRLMLTRAPLKSVVAVTFTRRAAVEMRARLLKRVNALARLDAAELRADLAELLGRDPSDEEAGRAARLFEEVLEDAAGLFLGTIHTFCASLLRRFADEAGVDPGFAVLERGDDAWNEAATQMETAAVRDSAVLSELTSLGPKPGDVRARLRDVEKSRAELERWRAATAPAAADPDAVAAALSADLARSLFRGTALAGRDDPGIEDLRAGAAKAARAWFAHAAPALAATDPDNVKLAAEIASRRADLEAAAAGLDAGGDFHAAVERIRNILFTGNHDVRKTRSGTKQNGAAETRLAVLTEAAVPFRAVLTAVELLDVHRAASARLRFGLRTLARFAAVKARDRFLDFHDLERRAVDLVTDLDLGPWILYRLDARLDHLLVDEFQDTNRDQWNLLGSFAAEFLAAEAEDGAPRSVFCVGDVKQSIYAFRGAQPEIFGEVERWLDEHPLGGRLTLPTNFRSLPAVVDAVGDAFGKPPLSDYLGPVEQASVRQAAARRGPGEVLVLPPTEGGDQESNLEASARQAACIVRRLLEERTVEDGRGGRRPLRCGDILMLARFRSHLRFYEDALRRAGVPLVPAGRGALAASREVQDVVQLLRWLVFPADSAALAGALRSPLFRVSEESLQAALARRSGRGSLWETLRRDPPDDETARAADLLKDWRRRVGSEAVHRLLRRIYRDTAAPDRFEAALGEQARYNLLRLHDLALNHMSAPHPSLRGFLRDIENAELRSSEEEATLPETTEGRLRMMTIHGAKGLEAPVVLLVDAAVPLVKAPKRVRLGEGEATVFAPAGAFPHFAKESAALSEALAAHEAAALREEAHLLYVAMTRARDVLCVLGARLRNKGPNHLGWLREARGWDPAPAWLADAETPSAAGSAVGDAGEIVKVWSPPPVRTPIRTVHPSTLAAEDNAPAAAVAREAVAPATDGDDRRLALDHGTAVHLWLQRAAESGRMPPGSGPAHAEARAVFENPEHAWIFHPDKGIALCEAPVIAKLTAGSGGVEKRVLGTIDRLLIDDDAVTVIDFKTNRVAPDQVASLAAHYGPQMAAYREALAACLPDRPVRCLLLFTRLAGTSGPGLGLPVE